MLSKEEIKNIAELARLKLSSKDIEFYTKEISAVLEYVGELNKLNTDELEPTSQAKDLFSVYRKDEVLGVVQDKFLRGKLLRLVPFLEKNFVKVKNVFRM